MGCRAAKENITGATKSLRVIYTRYATDVSATAKTADNYPSVDGPRIEPLRGRSVPGKRNV